MKTVETEAEVLDDRTMTVTVKVPPEVEPGSHRILVCIKDTSRDDAPKAGSFLSALHVFRSSDTENWETYRREQIYDDDGR